MAWRIRSTKKNLNGGDSYLTVLSLRNEKKNTSKEKVLLSFAPFINSNMK